MSELNTVDEQPETARRGRPAKNASKPAKRRASTELAELRQRHATAVRLLRRAIDSLSNHGQPENVDAAHALMATVIDELEQP